MLQTIATYFPNLSAEQTAKISQLAPLYEEWNAKINVISRKDMEHFYLHHVLHSLALAKILPATGLAKETRVLDVGTGGGFPGLPLSILYPEVHWDLADSVRKKITVVEAIATSLQLKNVRAACTRVEALHNRYDLIVTRAVAPLAEVCGWVRPLWMRRQLNAQPNGLWAWKGTEAAQAEVQDLPRGSYWEIYPLSDFFAEEYFATKALVYVQSAG